MTMTDPWATYAPTLGKKLYRLGVEIAREYRDKPSYEKPGKTALLTRIRAVKGAKKIKRDAAAEAVAGLVEALRERAVAKRQPWTKFIGQHHQDTRHHRAEIALFGERFLERRRNVTRRPPAWDLGSPVERRERRTISAVLRADLFRRGAAGGDDTEVVFAGTPEQHDPSYYHAETHRWVALPVVTRPALAGYRVNHGKNWNVYRGRYKGWAATAVSRRIVVPRDWISTVRARGLAVVDGMMTLTAVPVDSFDPDCEVFAATWASQGRGYEVHEHHGYIARHRPSGIAYHREGETADRAVIGLRSKVRSQGKPGPTPRTRENAARRYAARFGDVPITLGDSDAAGNCRSGTLAWCNTVGIDPDAGSVPLARVVEGYLADPLPEAWRVIELVAKRADRRAA